MFNIRTPKSINEAARQARCFEKAVNMAAAGYTMVADYILQSGKYFRITSPEGAEYIADPLTGKCSCPDFAKHEETGCCKHILFVNILLEKEEEADLEQAARWEDMIANGYPG